VEVELDEFGSGRSMESRQAEPESEERQADDAGQLGRRLEERGEQRTARGVGDGRKDEAGKSGQQHGRLWQTQDEASVPDCSRQRYRRVDGKGQWLRYAEDLIQDMLVTWNESSRTNTTLNKPNAVRNSPSSPSLPRMSRAVTKQTAPAPAKSAVRSMVMTPK